MSQPKEIFATGITLNGDRFTGFKNDLSSDSTTDIASIYAMNRALEALILTGANPGEIYNVKSYGAVADVGIPGSGATVTGTNNKAAFDACIAAAPSNAMILVPSGNYLVSAPLATITTKRLNFRIIGNIYTNGASFLTFGGPGGADRQHTVELYGSIIGRVNIPAHSLTTVLAGTGPNYGTFTGTAFTIGINVNSMHIKANLIEGFAKAVEVLGGGGGGSQENTIAIQKITHCAIGISLRSTDGVSWCDKNIFTGWDGGHMRISGGKCVVLDGFSGAASTNGEVYNGAIRSNKFQFLAEAVDQIVIANGDITEPKFDITVEGGANTGVYGPQMTVPIPAIQCRIISPNYVRSPKWEGQGVLATHWMTNGMGIDGTINMPIWIGPGSTAYLGNTSLIDSAGVLNINVRTTLSFSNRNAIPANMKCVNLPGPKTVRTIIAATGQNIAADAEGLILYNHTAGSFSFVNASTNVSVRFTIKNIHGSNNLTLFNVSGKATLAPNEAVDVFCSGATFYAMTTGTSYTPAP